MITMLTKGVKYLTLGIVYPAAWTVNGLARVTRALFVAADRLDNAVLWVQRRSDRAVAKLMS